MKANEPAFPTKNHVGPDWSGLTKREYIAIEAMKGILSNPTIIELALRGLDDGAKLPQYVTAQANDMADVLLASWQFQEPPNAQ